MKTIKELKYDLTTNEGMKQLREDLINMGGMAISKNEESEKCELSIDDDTGNMLVKVFQNNGWIRIDEYNPIGSKCGEMFNGRWNIN